MRPAARFGIVAALALSACAGGDDPQEVLGTLERDRLELIAESNERLVELFVRGRRSCDGGRAARAPGGGDDGAASRTGPRQSRGGRAPARRAGRGPARARDRRGRAPRSRAPRAASPRSGANTSASRDLVERKLLSASGSGPGACTTRCRAGGARRGARPAAAARGRHAARAARAGPRRGRPRARRRWPSSMVSAERYSVRAPRPGLIEALPYEVGERPPVGAPLVIMLADGAPYARVHVPEPLRVAFAAGTAVEVRIDGVADPLPGHGPLRVLAGLFHALQLAHAEGSQPARLPRGDHARGRRGVETAGRRARPGPTRRWTLRRPRRATHPPSRRAASRGASARSSRSTTSI